MISFVLYNVFHVFPLSPPSFREIILGGFGILGIFRISYFGLVFDLAYQKWNNSCTYEFSFESENKNWEKILTLWPKYWISKNQDKVLSLQWCLGNNMTNISSEIYQYFVCLTSVLFHCFIHLIPVRTFQAMYFLHVKSWNGGVYTI